MNNASKQNAERAEQIVKSALDTLAATLEKGQSEGLRQHLETMARFHRYSFGNQCLIWGQNPEASRVEGFRAWQKLGRQVKKGEKGILIRSPYSIRKSTEDAGRDTEKVFMGFKAAYVFDVSQTEGDELPSLSIAQGNPGEAMKALKDFAGSQNIAIAYKKDLGAHGMSHGGRITLCEGLPEAEEFSTLVHELAHELMHNDDEKRSRLVVETEAEAVAFVVSQAAGLDAVQASADYIQLYRGDSATLRNSLGRIQKTARRLIECLDASESYQQAA